MISQAILASLIRTLVEHDVRFVLVGGLAVSVHGYPRATKDVDIIFDTLIENTERLASALDDLGAEVTIADTPEPEEGITASWLAEGGHFVFATDNGPLDALSSTRGKSYDDLAKQAVTAELADGTKVLVTSYEDLLDAKQAAGRPQDLADLEGLRSVREAPDGPSD